MKNLTVLLLVFTISFKSLAQVAGPNSGAGFTSVAIPGSHVNMVWVNQNNVANSDNAYAGFGNLSGVPVGSYSDYLVITDFGFALPPGASITGIIVEVERADNLFKAGDYSIKIVKNNSVTGTEKSTGQTFPFSDSYHSFGNTSDLWGESWTDTDINNAGFGVAIAARRSAAGGTSNGRVDHVRVFVFYSLGVLSTNFISLTGTPKNNIVQLAWTTKEEFNMGNYEVERSEDAVQFKKIATVKSKNSFTSTTYTVNDEKPIAGTEFYRVKSIDNNGIVKYSRTISVKFKQATVLQLYPNPWKPGSSLFVNNPSNEKLQVMFYDHTGKFIGTGFANGTSTVNNIILSAPTGIVFYKITNSLEAIKGSGTLMIIN